MAASIVLAATAVLAAGIYYYNGYNSGPAGSPPQTASASPPRQADPTPAPVPVGEGQDASLPVDAPSLADVSIVAHVDAPPPLTLVDADEGTEFTPTPVPSPPLIPSLPKDTPGPAAVEAAVAPPTAAPTPPEPETRQDAPSVVVGHVAMQTGGKMQAPDPAPQTTQSGSVNQVQSIPKKPDLKYPNLGSHLSQLVASVEEGQITAQQAAEGRSISGDESIAVTIHLSANVDEVVQFLDDRGGDPRNVGEDYIEAYVPVTLLGQVSELPGVLRVREIIPPRAGGPAQPGGTARP